MSHVLSPPQQLSSLRWSLQNHPYAPMRGTGCTHQSFFFCTSAGSCSCPVCGEVAPSFGRSHTSGMHGHLYAEINVDMHVHFADVVSRNHCGHFGGNYNVGRTGIFFLKKAGTPEGDSAGTSELTKLSQLIARCRAMEMGLLGRTGRSDCCAG